MTRVLDTANGAGAPAFYLSRPAGDTASSLAGQIIAASENGGLITIGPNDPTLSFPINTYSGLDLMQLHLPSGLQIAMVVVLVVNCTFSTIYLAEDATIVHGGMSPQAIYPTYAGKTHLIPPALPHPTKPGEFLVGLGLFSFTCNTWGNCCGALKFCTKEDGSGSTPAMAFWEHYSTSDPLVVSVAANLENYQGSAQKFHDSTVGTSPQVLKSSDSDGRLAISAAIGSPGENAASSPKASVIVRIHTPLPDYTIVTGDTLGDIAEAFYRDPTVYPQILAANPGKIADPNVIPSGLTLKMPDLV